METKPYRIQSPEDIAKDYGGNKQQIAQAMQMGIVDPTAGVLAGMFIDRMRSAQMQEMAPQTTVAQKVMGGAPAQAPLAQAGGLGATAPAMPPMAPEAGIGAPPMEGAPPGMAAGGEFQPPYMSGGGLSELPLPDTMFDEDRSGSYGGGGIVAFAEGDEVRTGGGFGDYIEQMIRKLDPNIQITGRARTPARNAEVGGVPNSYHIINAARDVRTPKGMKKSDFIAQLKSIFGPDYDVLPSKGDSVHVEPGSKLGEKVRAGARPSDAPSIARERDTRTAEGRAMSLEDAFGLSKRLTAPSEAELAAEEKMRARLEEQGSEEYYKKQRKDAIWEAMATFGANMASSKAPGLLQAIGEAAAATLPGMQASKKERKELKDRALEGLANLGIRDRKRRLEALEVGMDLFAKNLSAEQAERALAFQEKELVSRNTNARLDREATLAAALARRDNPTQFETIIAAIKEANPGMSRLQAIDYAKKKGYFGASQGGMALPGADGAGAEMDTSGMSIIGSRPVQ